jgi:hypothetical protein
LGHRTLKCALTIGTRSAQSIMASGFTAAQTGRTHDRTRPMLQQRQKVLAKAPSTHDPKRRSSRKVTAKIDKGACQLFICRNRFDADQFVAGSKRNGPSAHLQCFQNRKNGSLTLLKKHRSGHRLRLVYTMADGGWRGDLCLAPIGRLRCVRTRSSRSFCSALRSFRQSNNANESCTNDLSGVAPGRSGKSC